MIVNEIVLNLHPLINLTGDEYYEFCRMNPDVKFERDKEGRLIIVPPPGGWSGNRNTRITQRLANWAGTDGTGIAFDSSTEFCLPNGAYRSPDASWITLERWNTLTREQQETFPPIAPDFVVELRSKSDTLGKLQEKMQEYMDNGVRLGWLLDPYSKLVEIYRRGQEKEVRRSPATLPGEDVLLGFVLSMDGIL